MPLLFRYFCTSRDTCDVCLCWCHMAVSLETEQPCLFHHSFVRPAGLYPCLENSEKPQLRDCIRFSSVSPVRAFACLRRHVGCDSTCLWCRCPSVTSGICIFWEKRFFCLTYIQRLLFVFELLSFTRWHKRGTSANVRGHI